MAGRGVHRGVHSALLDDPDFQRLSTDARLALYTVRLCKQAGPAVIFRYYPALLSAQSGLSPRRLEAALVELEAGRWIAREGVVLWVRNGLRHDPTMRLANRKHRAAVDRAVAELPHCQLVLTFCDYYKIAKPFESHSIGDPGLTLRRPKKTEEDRSTTKLDNQDDRSIGGSNNNSNGHSPSEYHDAVAVALAVEAGHITQEQGSERLRELGKGPGR